MKSLRRTLLPLIGLFLLLTALAALHLNAALWTDEMVTLQHIGAVPNFGPISLQETLLHVASDPWQAPLYFALVYGWGHVAGWSPFALRALSLFFGLLTLALLFRWVRRSFSAEIALYAVMTLGLGAFFINYLYDLRGYSLVTLCVVLLMLAYRQAAKPDAGWRRDLLLIAAVAAVFYTHYFAIIAVIALGIYHLTLGSRRWQVTADFVLGEVVFLPWSLVFAQGLLLSAHDIRTSFNMTPLEIPYNVLYMFSNGAQALLLLLALAAARRRTRAALFAWFMLIVGLALVIVASRVFTSLHDIRYLIFLWPPLAVIAGIGIAELRRRGIPASALLGIWLVACLWNVGSAAEQNRILPIEYRPPFDALRRELDSLTRAGDAVLYALPQLAPDDEMHPELLKYYLSNLNLRRAVLLPDTEATTEALYAQNVRAAVEGASRVWLTFEAARRDWHVGPVTEQLLPAAGFASCGTLSAEGDAIHAELWARRDLLRDAPAWDFPTGDGGQIHLQAAQIAQTAPRALSVSLQWTTENVGSDAYSLALHVLDGAGQLAAQVDHGVGRGGFGCLAQTIDLSQAAPGQYTVRLGAYNWQTSARLMPDGASEWPVVDRVEVGG